MEIKVKDLGTLDQPSLREEEAFGFVDESPSDENAGEASVDGEPIVDEPDGGEDPEGGKPSGEEPIADEKTVEFTDEAVLEYLKTNKGLELSSFDDLTAKQKEELPPDVEAYYKFKQETGRGIEDFFKLNRNFDSMEPNQLLREYYGQTEEGLDSEDIDILLENFDYDEDLDDESDVKNKKIALKKEIAKAKKYFEKQKETFRQPTESVEQAQKLSEELEEYRRYKDETKSLETKEREKSERFVQKTNELFNKEFKGFEFEVDGKSILFNPGDVDEIKKANSTPMNFINKHLDENGMLKDAVGYHRGLSVAMNPEKFAKFFYEQGAASVVSDESRESKNVRMGVRKAPEYTDRGGLKVKALNPSESRGLKIKFKK